MHKYTVLLMMLLVLACGPAFAEGEWNDALTPMGAENGPNADATIPAWNGGIVTPPQGYTKGGYHPDPFSGDKALFTITSDNLAQYKDNLSDGQKAMFAKHPDYQMPVYVTRRSASYPDFVYEAVRKNAQTTLLGENGDSVKGGGMAVPFPIPKNGLEAIWNHLLRYRGQGIDRTVAQVAVLAPDRFVNKVEREQIMFPFSSPGASFDSSSNILAYLKQELFSPPRTAGTLLLVFEPLDKTKEMRRSWLYNPGQRRVSRAPFINYDATPPTDWGLRTFDQYDLFNGATDRYDWTLEGKQEMYVPYNAYQFASAKPDITKIVGPNFLNPELTRYELHRVWKINAVLKKGKSHIYGRRVFYLDEDSWQILVCDIYDSRGELWRLSEAHVINFYEVPLIMPALEVHYDLRSGQYLAGLLQTVPPDLSAKLSPDDFTPETLRREGNR